MARILIVDDSRLIRNIIRAELEKAGHTIAGEASSGKEAISLCAKEKPDIITLDLTMDDMDGIEVLKTIRAVNGEVRFIIISALRQENLMGAAKMFGAVDYLTKPFTPEELCLRVGKAT